MKRGKTNSKNTTTKKAGTRQHTHKIYAHVHLYNERTSENLSIQSRKRIIHL